MAEELSLETLSDKTAKSLIDAATAAKASWDKTRQHSTREFVVLCRKVAAITDGVTTHAKKSQVADLWKALGNPSDFTRSAWRVIGTQADALDKHAGRLPSAQEAIKELARAEKKKAGSVDELMKTINENSSVGDVRKAVAKVLREPAPNVSTSNAHHAELTAIQLKEAVATLKAGLMANGSISVSVSDDQELADALLDALGEWTNDISHASRLVIDGESPHPLAEFERSGKARKMEKLLGVHLERLRDAECKASWAFVKKTHSEYQKEYQARLKRNKKDLWKASVDPERLGWEPEDLRDPVLEGDVWLSVSSANQIDDAPEGTSVKAVADTLGQLATGLEAAVKKGVARVKKSKSLLELEAEYEKAVKASPSERYEPDALITNVLVDRRKWKRNLSPLKP